eukprot:scaffold5522_cov334-Pinguiococcus_pyrenoidosus.AAC.6
MSIRLYYVFLAMSPVWRCGTPTRGAFRGSQPSEVIGYTPKLFDPQQLGPIANRHATHVRRKPHRWAELLLFRRGPGRLPADREPERRSRNEKGTMFP